MKLDRIVVLDGDAALGVDFHRRVAEGFLRLADRLRAHCLSGDADTEIVDAATRLSAFDARGPAPRVYREAVRADRSGRIAFPWICSST